MPRTADEIAATNKLGLRHAGHMIDDYARGRAHARVELVLRDGMVDHVRAEFTIKIVPVQLPKKAA